MMKVHEETGRPELNEVEQDRRRNLVDGLRAIANFYESRPNLPAPWSVVDVVVYAESKQELAAIIREAGSLEKYGDKSDSFMRLRRHFGLVEFRIAAMKSQTCERVKVGEEIVPAKPARTIELPAEPEKVVEKFEWQCSEPLLAPIQPAAVEQAEAVEA